MGTTGFFDAIEDALSQAMAEDDRIVYFGEDVSLIHHGLFVQFGAERVLDTPISEAAFIGMAVSAAMAGLKPVAEVYMADFLTVASDALVNQAAKIGVFSGGKWNVPLVVRTTCGGGYGDGGQHEQSLWGWLAHIPGLDVVVPSTPADAGGLMLAALQSNGPVIFMEHKLLSSVWLEALGTGGRKNLPLDVPPAGASGLTPKTWQPIPIGKAVERRSGGDLTIISVGVGVHRALQAAAELERTGVSAAVIDLRTVSPLDTGLIIDSIAKTGCLLVVDEDYQAFGLSGELAALGLEAGLTFRYARVCTEGTIPYARLAEELALPNTRRILQAAFRLLEPGRAGDLQQRLNS